MEEAVSFSNFLSFLSSLTLLFIISFSNSSLSLGFTFCLGTLIHGWFSSKSSIISSLPKAGG